MIEHLCTKQSIPLPNFAQENAFKMALFSCWQQSDIYIHVVNTKSTVYLFHILLL